MNDRLGKQHKSVKRKYVRIILIPIVGLIVISGIFIYSIYRITKDNIQEREFERLSAIVHTLAVNIEGEKIENLIETYPKKDDITENDQDEVYAEISKFLYQAQVGSKLPTDIYILVKREGMKEMLDNSFFFTISSNQEKPYYRHPYTPKQKLFDNYKYGGTLDPYTSANGRWISAFCPIKNKEGKVVGVVEADLELTMFYEEARSEVIDTILPISLVVIVLVTLIAFLINYTIRAIVTFNNNEMGKVITKMEQTQQTIRDFTTSIENGDYESEIVMDESNQTGGIMQSLVHMRDNLKESHEEGLVRKWTNEGLAKFADILRQDNDDLTKLADNIMVNLINYLDANQGSLFVLEETDEGEMALVMKACYAYNRKKYLNKAVKAGQGLVGQSYLERDTIYLKDLPDDYVNITSGLGQATPNNALIVPLQVNEDIYGVVELASFEIFTPDRISFVEKIAENIASTLYAVQSNNKTKELLTESKMLTENMRAQEEEMRQNMEEMAATQEEMQRNRQRLEKSQEKSKFIIECVSEMVVIISGTGQILEVNAKFINSLRYDQDSATKLHVSDVIVGLNLDDPNSFLWNIHEMKIKTSEGKRFDASIFFGEIYDEEGNPNYVALMTDLSEIIKKDEEISSLQHDLEKAKETIEQLRQA